MANFPSREAEVLALAQELGAGLTTHTDIYPAPPISPTALGTVVGDYIEAKDAAVAAQATAEQAIAAKDEALQALVDDMKADLRYAENTVDYDDAKLKLLGWGGRKAKTSLVPPGQARSLEAPREGEGWIYLDWKEPAEGGKVAAYRIERRQRPEGPWGDIAMAMESEATLADQQRGIEWEYRIVAVNKAGEGTPSNTVMAVL
jgi:hypothetical protein